jgi:RHS repeat-associated protein
MTPGKDYAFEVKATDQNGKVSSQTLSLHINAPPVITGFNSLTTPEPAFPVLLPLATFVINATATDPDNTNVSYYWQQTSNLPCDLSGENTAALTLSNLTAGTYTFELTVTDPEGETDTKTCQVTVTGGDGSALIAYAGKDRLIAQTQTPVSVVLSGAEITDPNNQPLTYSWAQISGDVVSILTPDAQDITLDILKAGEYVFRLTVTNADGESDTDQIKITISPNQPPIAAAGPDRFVYLPVPTITLIGSDKENSPLQYAWQQIGTSPNTAELTNADKSAVTINGNLVTGEYEFELTVTDQAGLSSSDRVKLRVGEGNEAYTYTQVSQENGAYFLASFAQGGITQTTTATREVGDKKYELKDHLGNMRVVIGDEKEAEGSGTVTLKVALRNYSNYYAFGMGMPNGSWSASNYRYGFNGKEKENDWSGYDFGARLYDEKIARFRSVDPRSWIFPDISPYIYADDNPIALVDVDGEGPILPPVYNLSNFQRARSYDITLYDAFKSSHNSSLSHLQKAAWYNVTHTVKTNWWTNYGVAGEAQVLKTLNAFSFSGVVADSYKSGLPDVEKALDLAKHALFNVEIKHSPDKLTDISLNAKGVTQETPFYHTFDVVGISYNPFLGWQAQVTGARIEKYTKNTEFIYEVKTLSPDNEDIIGLIESGIRQLLVNPKVEGGGVPVLVIDKGTFLKAVSSKEGRVKITDGINALRRKGGGVFLEDGLNKKASESLDNLIKGIRLTDAPPSNYYDKTDEKNKHE